jgi:hypothetical protein
MDTNPKKSHDNNVGKESTAPQPIETVENPNPKANKNIRETNDNPASGNRGSEGTGSEITDGEDA